MIIEDLSTVPHFGFGLMRLPVLDADDKTRIDYEQLDRMVDAFLDAGFTYFDTAYPHHGGWSKRAVKECLVGRHEREGFLLADKMPAWSLKQPGDVERIFAEQLGRTGADFFDFYLLHSVESQWYPVYNEYGCWEWARRMSDEAQMDDSLATVRELEPLSEAERDAIAEVTRQLLDKPTIGCTACRYCVDGCPMRIEIPELFRAMNAATLYGNGMRPREHYRQATSGGHGRASDCIACGACAMSCPQHLPIPDLLVRVAEEFDDE